MPLVNKQICVLTLAAILGLAFSPPVAAESYTYDDTGRLTSVVYDDGSSITYTYDNNGNLLLVEHSAAPAVDTDGDGMPDDFEIANGFDPNNPADANEDADSDGLTNLEEFIAGTQPHNPDTDGDAVLDGSDAFPNDPNESVDTDGDGIGNNADTDDDGDTMPDAYELANGLDPLNAADAAADADGDGFTNLEEFQAGTDPQNAEDFPTARKVPIAIFILLDDEE